MFPNTDYRYNGKELDEATGLYDYGVRYYDPAVARFTSIDRFASKYAALSTCGYTAGNPIKFIDMNGDSLVGVNKTSAQRALSTIQGLFGSGAGAQRMAALFFLCDNGISFNKINAGDFLNALGGLSTEGQALAMGYYQGVNSDRVNVVEGATVV